MSKYLTCLTRDARMFLESHVGGQRIAGELINSKIEDSVKLWQKKLWQKLALSILHNLHAWEKSEDRPLYFSAPKNNGNIRCSSEILDPPLGITVGFWLYKSRIYIESRGSQFSEEEREFLVHKQYLKETKQFENLKTSLDASSKPVRHRSQIPSKVKIFVWQRDCGQCVDCGSKENLEYDHIIPFAKGGSNTERNLQLLCGNCNRLKSDKIQ